MRPSVHIRQYIGRAICILLSLCAYVSVMAQETVSEEQLYFTVSASRSRVYEQEAVLLTYTFHVRGSMGLSVGISSKPDFDGLVSQEIPMPDNKPVYTETVNGVVQRAGVVKQSLVFPQRSGRITVPGLTFNCEVQLGEGKFGKPIKVNRKVADIVLEVDPLPKPSPQAFHGAVGKFEVKSSLSTQSTKTGDIASRLLSVSGSGNLRLITPPNLAFPDAFDVFDPTIEDRTRVSSEGLQGEVVFNYSFMPRKVGNFTLPADTFCYFDPQERAYRSIVIPSQQMAVKQGARSAEEIAAEAELRRSNIRPDHAPHAASLFEKGGFWAWLVSICLVIIAYVVADRVLTRRRNAQKVLRGVAGAHVRARKGLDRTNELLNKNQFMEAMSVLERTLTNYAAEYVNDSSITDYKEMSAALTGKGFKSDAVSKWNELLKEINSVRFAPSSDSAENGRALVQRAEEVLKSLDLKP